MLRPKTFIDRLENVPGEISRSFLRTKQFWHIVTLVAFLGYPLVAIAGSQPLLSWRNAGLVGCALALTALYLYAFVSPAQWPGPAHRFVLHFVGGAALVTVASMLNPGMSGLYWVFYGQCFSMALSRRFVLPYFAVITLLFGLVLTNGQPWRASATFWAPLLASALFGAVGYIGASSTNALNRQREQLVRRLTEANNALEAARPRDAELVRLQERERIARDMHDSLGHALVTLSVQLEAAQRLYKVDASRGHAQLEQLKNLTRDSMSVLRRSIEGLRAPSLGDRALSAALQQMCVDVGQRSGLNITCSVDTRADALSPDMAETLWNISQEALNNIHKHAHARSAVLSLTVLTDRVNLMLRDDGVGISVEPPAGRYGLLGMTERVQALRGTLTLRNDNGTVLEASLPMAVTEGF